MPHLSGSWFNQRDYCAISLKINFLSGNFPMHNSVHVLTLIHMPYSGNIIWKAPNKVQYNLVKLHMNNIVLLPEFTFGFLQIQSHQLGLMGCQGNGIINCRHSAIVAFSRLNWIVGCETQFAIWNSCFIRFKLTPIWLAEWTRENIENNTDTDRSGLFWFNEWNSIWGYIEYQMKAAN